MADRGHNKRRKMARRDDLAHARGFDDRLDFANHVAFHLLDLGIEPRDRRLALLAADDGHLEPVADVDAAQQANILLAIKVPRAGKDVA